MIQDLLARFPALTWPLAFLLGSLAVYLIVLAVVWRRPRDRERYRRVAALPLAPDSGGDRDPEGRKA